MQPLQLPFDKFKINVNTCQSDATHMVTSGKRVFLESTMAMEVVWGEEENLTRQSWACHATTARQPTARGQ